MNSTLGILSLVLFTVHATACWLAGRGAEALWSCHLATAVTGAGLVLRCPAGAAVGCFWSLIGGPFWLLDIATGAELVPTSILTHLGGFLVAVAAVRRMPVPRHAWVWSVAGLAALQQLCRWTTPPAANVNAAFAVYGRFDGWFPSYGCYLAALALVASTCFWALQQLLQRALPKGAAPAPGDCREPAL